MKRFLTCCMAGLFLLASAAGFAVSEGIDDGSNNEWTGAVTFTVPDTLTGNLNNDGGALPTDYFVCSVSVGQTYSVVATMPFSDVAVDIENSSGGLVAQGVAAGDENFTFVATTSPTYVVVYSGVPSGMTYNVTVSQVSGIGDWNLY